MSEFVEHLEAMMEERGGAFTEEERMEIAIVGADVIDLQARALAGEDVEDEIAVVNATLHNIAATKAITGARMMQDALRKFVLNALLKIA